MSEIHFTGYFRERMRLRSVPEAAVRKILTESTERYFDLETVRFVALGRARFGRKGARLLMVAYEQQGNILTAVTVHDVTRLQVRAHIKSGRWIEE